MIRIFVNYPSLSFDLLIGSLLTPLSGFQKHQCFSENSW